MRFNDYLSTFLKIHNHHSHFKLMEENLKCLVVFCIKIIIPETDMHKSKLQEKFLKM